MAFFSEAIEDICGYPPSDFINNRVRSFTSIIHPQDRARVEQAVRQGMKAKRPYVIEYRIVRADGSLAWVYDKGQASSVRKERENHKSCLYRSMGSFWISAIANKLKPICGVPKRS
jgi:PAS domain S-box-containing protein